MEKKQPTSKRDDKLEDSFVRGDFKLGPSMLRGIGWAIAAAVTAIWFLIKLLAGIGGGNGGNP